MNTETGEIKGFRQGDEPGAPWVPLEEPPKSWCRVCRGKGCTRRLVKLPGRRGRFVNWYQACICTKKVSL